ncbi:DUF1120 domain-containing protein [Andreprevotia chitinilytica]|uniref:DUF1120 domain-containing protein n=1 Tax=Andreprevotia chitinilytica TaxID=396808 RepID=UPI0005584F23|nr:DUF1120 domain-containing protein [Andreprevotia chitinilytica]
MKHLNVRNTLMALALTGAAAASFAATTSTLDLTVGGTISPAPCTLDFGAGNTVDFGTTKASALSKTAYYDLGTKATSANITCSAAIKVGFKVTDDRAASAIKDTAMSTTLGNPGTGEMYGLGTVGTAQIGSYVIDMSTKATFDGTQLATNLYSGDNKVWTINVKWMTPNFTYSAGASAAAGPIAGKVMTYPLSIHAALNKSTALNLVNDINLDGAATFELVYL